MTPKFARILVISLGLVALTASTHALAADCTIRSIHSWDYGIDVACADGQHYYTGTSLGCQYAKSGDAVKLWTSLFQAALLAGKSLSFSYTTCGNDRYVTEATLNM